MADKVSVTIGVAVVEAVDRVPVGAVLSNLIPVKVTCGSSLRPVP